MLGCQLLHTQSFRGVTHELSEHQNSSLKNKSILEDAAGCTSALLVKMPYVKPFCPGNKKHPYVPGNKSLLKLDAIRGFT